MANTDIKPRVRIPKKLKRGQLFEVKTIVSHPMETGLRKDKATGKPIPRNILKELRAQYGGKEVLRAVWHPAVSANPYTAFYVVAEESGPIILTWTDDAGVSYTKEVMINVQG